MLVGFSSLGSFSSRFSEMVGMSPSAFQRASAARGGSAPDPGLLPHGLGPCPRRRRLRRASAPSGRKSAISEKPETRPPYPDPGQPDGVDDRRRTSEGHHMIKHDVPHQRLRPGPGFRQGLLHREARFRGALRHHHGGGVRGGRAPGSAGSPSGRRTSPTSRSSCPRATWVVRPRPRRSFARWSPAAPWASGSWQTDDCHRTYEELRGQGRDLPLRARRASLRDRGDAARRLGQHDQPGAAVGVRRRATLRRAS